MTTVAIVPLHRGLNNNRLFDSSMRKGNNLERFSLLRRRLKEENIECYTLDACQNRCVDIVLFSRIDVELRDVLGAVKLNPRVRFIYVPNEPMIIAPMHRRSILKTLPVDRILTWSDRLAAECSKAIKCNIGQPVICLPAIPSIPFQNKKFCAAVYSNKMIGGRNSLYKDRQDIMVYFAKMNMCDIYGIGWGRTKITTLKTSYLGEISDKVSTLKKYKFCICFENYAANGLITEKIFDCFAAGTVPIYYGAPDILEFIPKSCFIDFRDFGGYKELYQYLVDMHDADYQSYLDAVNAFIQTTEYYEFTSKRYVEIVLEQIRLLIHGQMPYRTILSFKRDLLRIIIKNPLYFMLNIKRCKRYLFDLVSVW